MDFRTRRKVMLTLLTLMVLCQGSVWARASAAQSGTGSQLSSKPVVVQSVAVVRSADGVRVVIRGDRHMQTTLARMSAPDRLVVDVKNARFAGYLDRIDVGSKEVKSVRVGVRYEDGSPITRVVADLSASWKYDLISADNILTLKIEPSPAVVPLPVVDPTSEDASPQSAAEVAPDVLSDQEESSAQFTGDFGVGITGQREDSLLGEDAKSRYKQSKRGKTSDVISSDDEMPAPLSLRLSGTATAGYYSTNTESGYVARESSPVGSLRLDASGYFHSPDFLSFSVKPQGSLGRQSSEGVLPDGQGVAANATFLGGGVAPLTVSYSRLNRKLLTFGPLDRLAGLEANTFQDSLGVNWRIRLKHLPDLGLHFSRYSDSYEPLAGLAPKTTNASRLYAAEMGEKVFGWKLQARYKLERAEQDLINIFDPAQAPYDYQRKDQEARFFADRDLGNWASFAFQGGDTKSQNEVQGRPFDQSFRFLSGSSILKPTKKLMFSFRAGATDNVVGAMLERAAQSGSSVPAEPLLLLPAQAKLQMFSYFGSAQYGITNDLRIYADMTRENTRSPGNSNLVTPGSTLTSAQTGMAYTHRFRLWQVRADYAANGGRFAYEGTGSSRSFGQRGSFGVTVGSQRAIQLSAGLRGSLQDVTGTTSMHDTNWGANLTASRTLRENLKLEVTYDRDQNRYDFSSTKFRSLGNGVTISVVHPRAEFTASYNVRDGLTFQADPRLQYVSPDQSGVLLGAFPDTLIVPTGAAWTSAAFSLRPVEKFTARVAWLRSRQRLQNAVSNFYTDWEASVGYRFRSITIDAGYTIHNQDFGVDLFRRNQFFIRVVRDFTIF